MNGTLKVKDQLNFVINLEQNYEVEKLFNGTLIKSIDFNNTFEPVH